MIMAVDPTDAAEIAAIERDESALVARRDAIAAKWGEGAVVMKAPGDPYVMIVVKGRLKTVAVTYLSGGGS